MLEPTTLEVAATAAANQPVSGLKKPSARKIITVPVVVAEKENTAEPAVLPTAAVGMPLSTVPDFQVGTTSTVTRRAIAGSRTARTGNAASAASAVSKKRGVAAMDAGAVAPAKRQGAIAPDSTRPQAVTVIPTTAAASSNDELTLSEFVRTHLFEAVPKTDAALAPEPAVKKTMATAVRAHACSLFLHCYDGTHD